MQDILEKRDLPLFRFAKPFTVIAFLFVMGVILFCAFSADSEKTVFDPSGEPVRLKAYLDSAEKVEAGDSFRGSPDHTEVFYATLPAVIENDSALMLKSAYCKTQVYAKEELLGSYGTVLPLPFGEMIGNIRVIVPIDPAYAGAQLKINYTSYYDADVDYPELLFAPEGNLLLHVLYANMPRIIICIVLLTMALIALAMSIYSTFSGSKEVVMMLLSFISFVFFVLTWIICSSDIPQFFTNNNETVSLISFLTLSALAIPFSAFCARILTVGREIFKVNAVIGWLLPVTICICFVTNVCDPYHLLILTHLYIAFTLITAIICAFRQWKNDRVVIILALSLIFLFVFALIGLILFYISKTDGYDAVFFGAGLALFILMLFALILNRQMGYYEQRRAAQIYKELAYTDFLTKIPNRTAFESYQEELKASKTQHHVTFYVLDLNDLKKINDRQGHQEGDKAIRATAVCVEKAFRSKGKYFRVGGDEFCVIVLDRKEEAHLYRNEFIEQVEHYNKTAENPIRVAVGYAGAELVGDASFFRELFAKADQEMYIDKQRMKKERKNKETM